MVVAPLQTVHGIWRGEPPGVPKHFPSRRAALLLPLLQQQLRRQIPARKFVLCRSHTGRFGICCCCNHPCSIGAGWLAASSYHRNPPLYCVGLFIFFSLISFLPPPLPRPSFFSLSFKKNSFGLFVCGRI